MVVRHVIGQHWALLNRISREANDKPVSLRSVQNLTGQARAILGIEQLVKTHQFLIIRCQQPRLPLFVDVNVTGRTSAGTATLSFYRHTLIPQHLHQTPAGQRSQIAVRAIGQPSLRGVGFIHIVHVGILLVRKMHENIFLK